MFDKIAILIPSCDKYVDLQKPFFELFEKFWPNRKYKTYYLSNTKGANKEKITDVLVGKDVSWSDNLIETLNKIPEEYVFLWLDDLFLIKEVDEGLLNRLFSWALETKVNYLSISAAPKPDEEVNELVGLISPGSLYRVSTALSLWNKKTLLGLLNRGETAWEFEINGSARSDKYGDFYGTYEPVVKVINGVIKGRWRRWAITKLHLLGVRPLINIRPENTYLEEFLFILKILRSYILRLLPPKHRRAVRTFFKKNERFN